MKYCTSGEVALHNSSDDCWVSIFDDIYDLTDLLRENPGVLIDPIVSAAGTSITHWFNQKGDLRTYVDPVRNIEMPYLPQGRFLHVPPDDPMAFSVSTSNPWWKDKKYIIGKLTKKSRKVKVVNMLTGAEDIIDTCEEETINDIRDRYMEYNRHGGSYTWKALKNDEFCPLTMEETLSQNGFPDESENFLKLGMDEDFYIPTLHIYFNDDLTYA